MEISMAVKYEKEIIPLTSNWEEKRAQKILMIHIGGYPGHYEPKARSRIEMVQFPIFLSAATRIS